MTEEALFHAVLTVPASDRPAYLAAHCPDRDLRRRIEDLLAAHDRSAGPLDASPATGEFHPGSESALPNPTAEIRQIGPYKLLQRIGEGGMGAVYMAEQQHPVRRMVAVKVIKPGMDSAQVVARFEAERQALAMMDHPNIAKILDGGMTGEPGALATGGGLPYFVMELVKGIPITKYCDQQHLTPRERLELFVPVCHAVQHAHQKGVIHRDLKPTNVLVALYDGRPVPKVIDFGVAKALHNRLTEKTMFTEFGAIVGTLEYMSPEQAELNQLDIDTRSDIYSLGVLLYELLTGSTPFDRKRLTAAAFDELLRIIREEEPPKPSTRLSASEELPSIAANRRTEPKRLNKLVRGELDWVVMKCLEKDRGRRYETANGLAMDVQRYLADDMVQARPPTAGYRLRKFVRRNKGPVVTATLMLLALVVGVIGATWGWRTATVAEAVAQKERDDANAARVGERSERVRADAAAEKATASARDARRFADGLTVDKGLRLAAERKLFEAMASFAKPLARNDLAPDEERVHRLRLAMHMRYAAERMTLRQVMSNDVPVNRLGFSADGRRLLVCSGTKLTSFDCATGERVGEPLETGVTIYSARFCPDERRVTIAGWKNEPGYIVPVIQSWDAERRKMVESVIVPADYFAPMFWAFAPGGTTLAATVSSAAWFIENPTLSLLSNDGRWAAVTSGRRATIWDTRTGRPHGPPVVHPFVIESVQFSADGRAVLFNGSAEKAEKRPDEWQAAVMVLDLESSRPPVVRGEPGRIYGACLTQNGRYFGLVTMRQFNNILTIYDTQTGRRVGGEESFNTTWVGRPGGQIQLLPARGDSLLIVYPVYSVANRDWTYLARSISPRDGEQWQLLCQNWYPTEISFSPDRRTAMVGNGILSQVWDVSTGAAVSSFFPSSPAAAGTFSADGRFLAQCSDPQSVRIWDLAGAAASAGGYDPSIRRPPSDAYGSGGPQFSLSPQPESDPYVERIIARLPADIREDVEDLISSPDGVTFATKQGKMSKDVQLWSTRAAARIGRPFPIRGDCAFSPDGRYFVAESTGGVTIVDAKSGRVEREIPNSSLDGFAHDGRVMYEDKVEKKCWLLDVASGSKDSFPYCYGGDGQYCLAVSHDRRIILPFGDGVESLQLFSTDDGKALRPPVVQSVRRAAFSPDDRVLAVHSGSDITLYEVPSLVPISPPVTTESGQRGLWFNAAGTRLETNDGDYWDLTLPPRGDPLTAQSALAAAYAGFTLDDLGAAIAHPIDSVFPDSNERPLRRWLEYAHVNRLPEVAVTSDAVFRWREDQSNGESTFHRRWLAAELLEAGWRPMPDDYREVSRHFIRLQAYAACGPSAVATDVAGALARKYPKSESILYDAGKTFSLAAGAAKDAGVAHQNAARAVALLRTAVAAGHTDLSELAPNADFDPLRKRPDFADLLWDLADTSP